MKWTDQTPTEPGWRWWRPSEGSHHLLVYVTSELKAGYPFCEHRLVKELGGQWAGPSDEV